MTDANKAAKNVETAERLSSRVEDAMSELHAALMGIEATTEAQDDPDLLAADIDGLRDELAEARAHLAICKHRATRALAAAAATIAAL